MTLPPPPEPAALSFRAVAWKSGLNPGSGHSHLGHTTRGRIIMAGFFAVVLWAAAVGFELAFGFRALVEGYLQGGGSGNLLAGVGPVSALGVCSRVLPFTLLELIWYATLADSMHLAREECRRRGVQEAPDVGMVAVLSILSPGSGHLYAGRADRGWQIVGAYAGLKLLALPFTVRSLVSLSHAARALTGLDLEVIQGLTQSAAGGGAAVVGFLVTCAWSGALLDAVAPGPDLPAASGAPPHGGLVFLAGFLCPGAGHVLLGHEAHGRILVGGYLGVVGLATLSDGLALGLVASLVTYASLAHLGYLWSRR